MTMTDDRVTGRSLISPLLFDTLSRSIAIEERLTPELADRIVDQAVTFLGACAVNTARPLAPSRLVDIGWHAFILHTRQYAEFCDRVAARFLHHVPIQEDDADAHRQQAYDTLVRTVTAIEAAGFVVDRTLWRTVTGADCTGCHNGCHDDPPPQPAH